MVWGISLGAFVRAEPSDEKSITKTGANKIINPE
jgi:hypothetical protein